MWLDLHRCLLERNTGYTPFDVPLFPAIYSGYMVHYGRPVPRELPNDEASREYARTLSWGEAFGWIPLVCRRRRPHGRFEKRAKLIYDLACVRRDNAEFLVFGTLEDELRPLDADKAVFGTIWKNAANDRQCAAVVNASKYKKTVRFRFPASEKIVATEVRPWEVKMVRD